MPEIIYSVPLMRGTMHYLDALAAGYRTVGLDNRLWEIWDSERQEQTGRYRGFKETKQRTRIDYNVRFPGAHVVKPYWWGVFIVRVSSFDDAKKLARKGGEGTVIQRVVTPYRDIERSRRRGKSTTNWIGVRSGRKRKRELSYWIVRDGMLEPIEYVKHKIVADETT